MKDIFSSKMKKYRTDMGLSQELLAQELGVSPQAISKVNAGHGITCKGGIAGNVDAGHGITCGGGIAGDVSAGQEITCGGDIKGSVKAGTSIECKNIKSQDVVAGQIIKCKTITGETINISCRKELDCKVINGNVVFKKLED